MRCYIFIWFLFLTACSNPSMEKKSLAEIPQYIEEKAFQSILDSAKVQGSILIYAKEENTYYSNDFEWAKKGQLPASTFKIPNSIIALETGVVENDSTVFEWGGESRRLKTWEQDLIFRDAFHFSCVPCYQEIAREIGSERMNSFLEKFNYGSIHVDSTNIDIFWLQGKSTITPFQQIDFLDRFYDSLLPISERTGNIMKRMMLIKEDENYTLSGKTGWSIQDDVNNGWFVGYVETKGKEYYFATNVEPKDDFNMQQFPMIRRHVTIKALEALKIIVY